MDIIRTLLIKRRTRLTLVARFVLRSRRETVDGLGKNTRTSGLTHSTWTTEQVRMRKAIAANSIAQSLGQSLLTYHRLKSRRTILTG